MGRKLRGKGLSSSPAEETIDEKPKSLLLNLISQLKVGMDLSKVTLPTFILEPRSFLEKLTDFMLHSHLVLPVAKLPQEEERFLAVLRWYLSGWHLKPKGCKKPYNPILGESFSAAWENEEHGRTEFLAEQVSHHPPISTFHIYNPECGVVIDGVVYPRSKFLGNSAASILDGRASLFLTALDEEYVFTYPSYHVKGVVFGKLAMEIGDKATIECKKTGFSAEIEFKMKGMIFGKDQENMVVASVKKNGEKVFNVSGYWDDVIDITAAEKGSDPSEFVDVTVQAQSKLETKEAQDPTLGEFESRRLWAQVTAALKEDDQEKATQEKGRLEDRQRQEAKDRKEKGEEWIPKYFEKKEGEWCFKGKERTRKGEGKGLDLRELAEIK